jgi:hypothetical protein
VKFNFRKIASVLASTVMLSSTVALAAAANYPTPFITSGVADVSVVYGSSAATTDLTAALDITNSLNAKLVQAGTPTTVTGGDFFKLEKASNKFNLGENFTSVQTTLDDDELSNVLKSGVYEDEAGTEYDFDQKITLGGLILSHFADQEVNADEIPVIGFNIASGTNVLNYTLNFIDTVANSTALLETTYLEMLGRKYYISDWDATNLKMTLLDTANTATVVGSTPTEVVVGGVTYSVEIVSVDGTNDDAVLKVNGQEYSSIDKGNSRKIGTDTYLSVLDLSEASRESDSHRVQFSIGTGKIVLESAQKLVINDDTIDALTANFTVSSNKLTKLTLVWTTDEEMFLVPGADLVLPGFETIKFATGSLIRPSLETLTVTNSGDDYMEVNGLSLKDGSISNFPILYSNATKTGFAGLGKDSTHVLTTNATGSPTLTLNDSENTKFVASWVSSGTGDWESSAFELVSVNEVDSGLKNETKIKNLGDGKEIIFTDSGSGDDKTDGELTFTIPAGSNGDLGIARLRITATSSGTAYADRVITKNGLRFYLPVINGSAILGNLGGSTAAPYINISNGTAPASHPTSWIMNFSEGDQDNNVDAGPDFSITLNQSSPVYLTDRCSGLGGYGG